jgi:hypothetical protein
MRRTAVLAALILLGRLCVAADVATFDHVKIHRHKSEEKRVLVDKIGTLRFDDAGRKLSFSSGAGDEVNAPYDNVVKVIFETTTHMHGGVLAEVITAASFPGLIAGNALKAKHVHDYWFYIEYKNADQIEPVLLDLPDESSDDIMAKAKSIFGSRVEMPAFPENSVFIDPEKLPDFNSRHSLKVDKVNHPLPEEKPDKATIVVVCPPLAARYAGAGNQFKLHANDKVVAVNRGGTYTFAYLDPGKYRLVSQAGNANGFDIELEAGKSYYFLQNTFMGAVIGHTTLSRNSPELVMYELNGSYFADWKRK